MNRTDFRRWEEDQLLAWGDSPMASGADAMEWDTSLLLPQLVDGLERPAGVAKESTYELVGRLSSLWHVLRTTTRQSTRWSRVLSAN
ncbi:hypothetical protein [Pseudomonas sp. Q1-7]|uniref:hypothetical protein n=1 Tax=Pseudomonas sp. Q1-7 TaxID=3020843 RepID=UPI0023013965|nr:hypothetical protein [Pseudomonas sp. Q1-7]